MGDVLRCTHTIKINVLCACNDSYKPENHFTSMYVFLKSKQISLPYQSKYKHVTLAPFIPPFCIAVTEYDIQQSMESSIK